VKFDWFDPSTHSALFNILPTPINAIFIVAPPVVNQLPLTAAFLTLALSHNVRRFVLLSGSVLPVGDGPMMAAVSQHFVSLGVEYAILRPTWFMENFSEADHHRSIVEEDRIVTAAGDGRVPFVSVKNIAEVAVRALTDEVSHDRDYLIVGSDLFSYDQVATFLTNALGRKISHVRISEDEVAAQLYAVGIPDDYSRVLAQLDTYIAEGKEEIMNDVVEKVTGERPVSFEEFVLEAVGRGVWDKR